MRAGVTSRPFCQQDMKKIIREYSFTEAQKQEVEALAQACGLTSLTAQILYARGQDTPEKVERFLNPSESHFLSPFQLSGMREAVELIRRAKEEELRVAVFGDYDADGVCSTTILCYALRAYGIEPYLYIPERSEGYGLNVNAIDRIFDEYLPDLFITVDCGISNRREVAYIQEQGADVIVTDHHELPDELPDCICVNPKFEDAYPYDNLCGAGVAFKLACALLGRQAYDLIDFAALATVADSVPLLGENRDIVAEGLKKFNSHPRPCFTALLGKSAGAVTAQTLSFTIAPRINAAGRMGDANAALQLFLSESPQDIFDLAAKLTAYNAERQKYCDELYQQAKAMLAEKGAYRHCIMLAGENWNAGFVGIVAARLAEEYARPVLLFVANGDQLKGSARSIDTVNIFDALKHCSEQIEEFGGHAQAAGVNVTREKFAKLEDALDAYLAEHYTREDFVPTVFVAEEIQSPVSARFAHELSRLEPFGVGHRRPLFSLSAESCSARPIKEMSPHLSIKNDCIELLYFGGAKWLKLIESDVKKKFIFECNISSFRGREYIKGYVRDFLYDGNSGRRIGIGVFINMLNRCRQPLVSVEAEYLSGASMLEQIEAENAACPYGLCLIASDRNVLKTYPHLSRHPADMFYPSARNLANCVLISPCVDADLSGYEKIYFLDTPADFNINCLKGRTVFVNRDCCGYEGLKHLHTERSMLLNIFAALRAQAGTLIGSTAEEVALHCGALGFDLLDFIFALMVFEELGLIAYAGGRLVVYRGIKADLSASALYTRVVKLIG